jgi:hypothetical protein
VTFSNLSNNFSGNGSGLIGVLPAAGSPSYVQNGTIPQAANFNITGNATVGNAVSANVVNSATTYGIATSTVLSIGGTADQNLFLGVGAGSSDVTGQGLQNAFTGFQAGFNTTVGTGNSFSGYRAGYGNTTGSGNIALGSLAGMNNITGANNIYVGNRGPVLGNESNAIRIGDQANQASAYIAGITGASTNSGMPVFVDSTGKLGTGGGSVNFAQVSGTLTSPQFIGIYNNAVTLANAANVFNGAFTGNGAGLTGVASGLFWPIVTKSADYLIQISDFSTPSTHGNFLILTGPVSHTFTLPSPPPANGSCVAIGNVADAGVNSGTNVFLTVSPNGLNVDASAVLPTQPRRVAYLYCSDGAGYYRLGYNQNGVSEIGPWLYTVDTGVQDQLKTTFRNGMDFGLFTGSMIYLLPKFPNTSGTPTLDVNGLGAQKILRYGNHALAPGDLSTTALALLIYDGTYWELINPQTIAGTVTAVTATAPLVSSGGTTPNISCPTCITSAALSGATGSIGGSALIAGTCTTGTAAVTGAVVGHPVAVSASDGSLPNGLIILSAAVTSSNTVTVQLCATSSVTPIAKTYNVTTQ